MSATQEYLQNEFDKPSLLKRLGAYDWLWAALVAIGSWVAYSKYSSLMDGYEVGILFGSAIGLIIFGWYWKPMRHFSLVVAVLSLAAIGLYGDELARGESNFFLKYLSSSHSTSLPRASSTPWRLSEENSCAVASV